MILQRALLPAANSGGLVTSGLVFHLDAGNPASYPGSGSTWTNLVPGRTDAVLVNGPTYDANNGGSIVFDGINDYAAATMHATYPSGSNAVTLAAMIYPTAASGGREILGIGNNNGFVGAARYALWLAGTGAIGAEAINRNVLTTAWQGLNNWVYLCASIDAGQLVFSSKVYINGALVPVVTSGIFGNAVLNIQNVNGQVAIGTIPTVPSVHNYAGRIAVSKIYNRQLTDAEITQNFNALRGRFGI